MHSPKLVLYTLVLQISTDIHDIVDIVDIHYSGRVWLGLGRVVARVEAERAAARGARAARVASLLVGGRRVSAHPRGGAGAWLSGLEPTEPTLAPVDVALGRLPVAVHQVLHRLARHDDLVLARSLRHLGEVGVPVRAARAVAVRAVQVACAQRGCAET